MLAFPEGRPIFVKFASFFVTLRFCKVSIISLMFFDGSNLPTCTKLDIGKLRLDFLLNILVSIECPITWTFYPLKGHEPVVAVKIPFVNRLHTLNAKLSEVCVYQSKCLTLKILVIGEISAACTLVIWEKITENLFNTSNRKKTNMNLTALDNLFPLCQLLENTLTFGLTL